MTSLRFWIQSLIRLLCSYELVITIFDTVVPIFVLSTHHDFVPISCSARITILCQFHVQQASRFRTKMLGPELHFRSCSDLPKFDVTKAMVSHQSCSKCHLQPYKRFIQMAYSCGTPLIHITHAQNGYIKSGLLRQSFEFFAFLDRVILGKLLKNW